MSIDFRCVKTQKRNLTVATGQFKLSKIRTLERRQSVVSRCGKLNAPPLKFQRLHHRVNRSTQLTEGGLSNTDTNCHSGLSGAR